MNTSVPLRFVSDFLVTAVHLFVLVPHTCDGDAVFRFTDCLGVRLLHEAIAAERHAVATRHILLAPLHQREAKPVVIVTARAGGFNLRGLLLYHLKLALSPVEQCAAD